MTEPLLDGNESTNRITMTNYHTTDIRVKDVSDSRLNKDSIIAFGAGDGPAGLEDSLEASIEASHNDGVQEAYDRAKREYDPDDLDNGTIIARVEPNGEVHWPLEETHDDT